MKTLVVTAAEAAELLKTSDSSVIKKLDAGIIPGYRDGNTWKIPVELLKEYVKDRALLEAKNRQMIREEESDE